MGFDDLKHNWKKRLGLDQSADVKTALSAQDEPEPANVDVLNPPVPKAPGINKAVTLGLLGLCFLVFIGSFVFGMGGKNKKQPLNEAKEVTSGNVQGSTVNQIPNSYQDLAKYNQTAAGKKQTKQQGQQGMPMDDYGAGAYNANVPVKAIPAASYYPADNYSPSGYPSSSNSAGPTNTFGKVMEFLKSPIRFTTSGAAGNGLNNNNGEDQPSGEATATTAATGVAYKNNSNYLPAELEAPESPYVLQAGAIIPSTLITGINSDLSGPVVAQVRENVYDSILGHYLLIPQGARLIGQVTGGNIKYGQSRVGVAWKRIILPNGYSINIGDMPATDDAGYPGMTDKVNNHGGRLARGILLSSVLSAGAMIAAGNEDAEDQSTSQFMTSAAAQNLMNTGAKIIDRELGVSTTLEIRPGYMFNVFVTKDMIMQPYEV